ADIGGSGVIIGVGVGVCVGVGVGVGGTVIFPAGFKAAILLEAKTLGIPIPNINMIDNVIISMFISYLPRIS
ncbi:MAG: hypothetical protein WCE99_06350, partial [Nitrososphaeraceae archaeon]